MRNTQTFLYALNKDFIEKKKIESNFLLKKISSVWKESFPFSVLFKA